MGLPLHYFIFSQEREKSSSSSRPFGRPSEAEILRSCERRLAKNQLRPVGPQMERPLDWGGGFLTPPHCTLPYPRGSSGWRTQSSG